MSQYDKAARDLWEKLGIEPPENRTTAGDSRGYGRYATMGAMSPIYKHPSGGGTIYVGDVSSSRDLGLLQSKGVTHVVNCTHGIGELPNCHEGVLKYYRFPISEWRSHVNINRDETTRAFTAQLWPFIDSAIQNGDSVLVHCLAGAHRAGTTGTSCLIHYAGLDVDTAIKTAKQLRPVIDPICDLPRYLEAVYKSKA
jgi:hypothetical protein